MPSATPASDRWIVLKFGGTSVSRRHRWDTIGKLAKKRAEETGSRVLVVVSALSGVTNELTAIADGAADSRERVAALVERHQAFLDELELPPSVLAERLAALQALLDDARCAARTLDWQAEVLGQGELLSSTLGVAYLRAQGLEAHLPRATHLAWTTGGLFVPDSEYDLFLQRGRAQPQAASA